LKLPRSGIGAALLALILWAGAVFPARADSTVVFNEIMYHPATNEAALEWIELHNQNVVDVDLSGWRISDGVEFEFANGTVIPGGGYLVVALSPADLQAQGFLGDVVGPFLGRLANNGERLQLYDINNRLMDSVNYGTGGNWPVGPDGTGVSLAKKQPDLGSGPAENWEASVRVGGTPGASNVSGDEPLTGATTNVIPVDATWRFHDAGVDLGSDWRAPDYDDVAWNSGPGLFYVEERPLPGPKNTPLALGRDTYYFRTTFPFDGNPDAKLFSLRPIVDDGAVIYLNGVEVSRVNMPSGPVSYSTMAASSVGDATFSAPIRIGSSNVVVGQNVLAVEVHQSSATTNPGLRVFTASGYTVSWDGDDGDYFSAGSPALAPAHAGLASLGVDVFASSNPGLASSLNDGRYGATGAWSPDASDPTPNVVLRFNQTISLSSIAWSRDNGDETEAACGGTCTDRSLGNYTFQYTLAADPSAVIINSSNPTNGWATLATVQQLSAQPGFSPHLRHRFDVATVSGAPILATGVRFRPPVASTIDELEINTPSQAGFDAVFGMELLATDVLPLPPKLVFNEVAAANETPFQLEIMNIGARSVDLAGVRISRARGGVWMEFPSQMVAPGGTRVVTQADLGFTVLEGDILSLYGQGGFDFLDSVRVRAGAQGRWPDGNGAWMIPSAASFGMSNIVSIPNQIVINEVMYHYPPSDPTPAVISNQTVVEVTGSWRYEDSGTDLGTAWRAPGFDDSSWPTGGGVFAFNAGSLPAPVNTTLAGGGTTYYFRTRFNFSGSTASLSLSLRSVVDDGAVFYLNGVEFYRQGMPLGSVNYSTSAAAAVGDAGYIESLDLPAAALAQGENVLAVEVHQATSGNLSGGIVLTGGGLSLVEEGPFGGVPPMNLARQPGAFPFAIDSLVGYPIHVYTHLDDGVYGNSNSWIGNSGNPGYAGIGFGGMYTINSIAFGRDNLGNYSDRTLGLYTLQYTRVAAPGTTTVFTGNADTGWDTIGTLNYQGAGGGLFTSPSRRHRFTFTPVDATAIRLLVPGTGLGAGTCIDELEVNPPDTSGDIAFAAELNLTTTLVPAQPFLKSDEEWVELYNRGSNALDLAQWSFTGTIDYLFPTGVVIQPGGYLVVARDAAALQAKWPEVAGAIMGDFSGRMSANDTLTLRDAVGNPANRITVFDVGYSGGGGSSIELIDPRADNSKEGVWRGSDESSHSHWQTVSYRMIAGQRYGSSLWNEFRLGLLDVADVLVDDVSVVRDPDGAAQELIQNGSFDVTTGNTHWRWLGSHQESRIIDDPDNPGNKVLKVSASAPARTSHNHVETSYVGNTPIVDGQEYEVSFQARWLGGAPLLTSSSYHQRLARTTVLEIPSRLGTPGQPNSTLVANAGPTVSNLRHTPVIPEPDQEVTISIRAEDPDGMGAVTLRYRVNPAASFTGLPMTLQADGQWSAVIPGQSAGSVVQFYVVAQDGTGRAAFAPQKGPDSRALYQVADTQGTALPAHELRLIQLDVDRDFLHQPTNVLSQARVGGTLIYDRSEVFYDVGVRLKGSAAGRIRDGDAYVSYDIRFPDDHLFRGVHGSVGIDRSGRAPVVRQQDEIYVLHTFQRAALPVHHADLCYFISPKTVHTGTAILQLGGYDTLFVNEQFGKDGSTFNFDLTYEPSTTVGGNYEGIKLPVPLQGHIGTDLTDLGNDKEEYRVPFSLRGGERQDYFDGIIRLCKTMSAPQPQFDAEIAQALDVDEALRVTALTILWGIGDSYFTGGLQHNLRLYTPADGGPAEFLPWDMDFVATQGATSSILPSYNVAKFMNNPNTHRRYFSHLYDLLETVFNTTYMTRWLQHYGSVVGQNYTGMASFINSRANYARSQLPAQVPFAITSNGGDAFEVETNLTVLTGTGWLDLRSLEVNGVPYLANWTGDTTWALTVPLASGVNVLALQGVDLAGNRRSDLAASITITNLTPPGFEPVVINEWMADNSGPSGFADPADGHFEDWFELYNPNDQAVDLSGYYLTDDLAQPTKWTIPANTFIPGRGFLLVWADQDLEQNGTGNGDLHADFKLNAGGDFLGLYAPDGLSPQNTVVFGPQTKNISQGLFPDGAVGTAQSMPDWTPRAPNRLGDPASPDITVISFTPGVELTMSFSTIPGRTYQIEYKDDLNAPAWTPLGGVRVATGPLITLTESLGLAPQRFFRARLE
jgi:Lamin Tail Domain/CotH kinase protein